MRFSPGGRCGCCNTCVIFEDEFGRADDDDIGSSWEEVAGNWAIDGNELTSDDSGALAIATATFTGGTHLRVMFSFPDGNASGRIVVDYEDDDNYHYVELDRGTTQTCVRLCIRSGGVDTGLSSYVCITNDTSHSAAVCFAGGTFSVRVSDSDEIENQYVSTSVTPFGGDRAGLGVSANVAVAFESFVWSKHYSEDSNCPKCVRCFACANDEDNVPEVVQVTLTGMPDSDCDGSYLVPFDNLSSVDCVWAVSGAAGADCSCGSVGYAFVVRVTFLGGSPAYKLEVITIFSTVTGLFNNPVQCNYYWTAFYDDPPTCFDVDLGQCDEAVSGHCTTSGISSPPSCGAETEPSCELLSL